MLGIQSGRGMLGAARVAAMMALMLAAAAGPKMFALGHGDAGQDWAMAATAVPELQLATMSVEREQRLSARATEGFRAVPLLGSWTVLEDMSEPKVLLLFGVGLFGAAGLCVAAAALRRGPGKAV